MIEVLKKLEEKSTELEKKYNRYEFTTLAGVYKDKWNEVREAAEVVRVNTEEGIVKQFYLTADAILDKIALDKEERMAFLKMGIFTIEDIAIYKADMYNYIMEKYAIMEQDCYSYYSLQYNKHIITLVQELQFYINELKELGLM